MKRGLEARCPFWKDRHDRPSGVICCEGITTDSTLTLRFRRPEKGSEHKKRFCAGAYKACPLFKAAMEKYGE